MQWTGGGLVPAIGFVPNAGEVKGGFVATEYSDPDPVVAEKHVRERLLRKPERKPAPKNVVSLAKARLREVKAELRRLKALEKEKGELERLIAAAENKPRKSNLRAI